jgi:two-component system sensor histidine kinase/response regulator
MVRLFLQNSGTRMDQIRTGVDGGDLEEAERGAHSLKSSAANIGAEGLRTLATRLESAALEGNADGTRALLPELESAYADAMNELERIEKGMDE